MSLPRNDLRNKMTGSELKQYKGAIGEAKNFTQNEEGSLKSTGRSSQSWFPTDIYGTIKSSLHNGMEWYLSSTNSLAHIYVCIYLNFVVITLPLRYALFIICI